MSQREQDYGGDERGGIALRDYTQGMPRRGFLGVKSGLQKVNFDRIGHRLVWASLGLGVLGLLAPRRVQKLIGVRCGNHSKLIRAWGMRELMSAFMIMGQARPMNGVFARVIGDAMDLGLLGAAFNTRRANKKRLIGATAFVAGTTVLDTLVASQLAKRQEEANEVSSLTRKEMKGLQKNGAFLVTRSITINKQPDELYTYWRDFENLPNFMYHLERVDVMDDRRSHWVAKAPAGAEVSWDAEITEDQPGNRIAWRALEDADVPNSGSVRFEPAMGNQGTVVHVEIEYRPPGGALGRAVAMLFGEEPGQQVKGDLNRFKQVMETGEVLRSDGSGAGIGQKIQHPAQPMHTESKGGKNFFTKFFAGKRSSGDEVSESGEKSAEGETSRRGARSRRAEKMGRGEKSGQ